MPHPHPKSESPRPSSGDCRLRASIIASAMLLAGAAQAQTLIGEFLEHGQPARGRFDIRLSRNAADAREQHVWTAQSVNAGQLRLPLPEAWEQALARGEVMVEVRSSGSGEPFSVVASTTNGAAQGTCPFDAWSVAGNSADADDFVGTTNEQPLRLGSNNRAVGRLQAFEVVENGSLSQGANIHLGWHGNPLFDNQIGTVVLGGGVHSGSVHSNSATGGARFASITGGLGNRVSALAAHVGGGRDNHASAIDAVVAGGRDNTAGGDHAVVAGGSNNAAIGQGAVIIGGGNNLAPGAGAVVLGGAINEAAGQFSVAAGFGALAAHDNSWVWYDGEANGGASSSAVGQVIFASEGGFGINTSHAAVPGLPMNAELTVASNAVVDGNVDVQLITQPQLNNAVNGFSLGAAIGGSFHLESLYNNNGVLRRDALLAVHADGSGRARLTLNRGSNGPQPGAVLQIGDGGNDGNGASLSAGGTWTNASGRRFKHRFSDVDPEAVLHRLLALKLAAWEYRESSEGRHLGPVAEDFQAAFGLGNDSQRIATVDADGVALAAIQGLYARVQRDNHALRELIDDLSARLAALERAEGPGLEHDPR